jgi:hypothetical protein
MGRTEGGSGFGSGIKKETPHRMPCESYIFEPGNPGGNPASILGFPALGPAHHALVGVPFLCVLAQKLMPHHEHGRGF